jgi:hypothetical protein
MEPQMAKLNDLELKTELKTEPKTPAPSPPAPTAEPAIAAAPATVNIPLEDVTTKVAEINQPRDVFAAREKPDPDRMTAAKRRDQEFHRLAQSRVDELRAKRLVHQTPEPVRAFPAIPPGIMSRTLEEMEAGRKMNAHHAGIQGNRPLPSKADQQAAGYTTPVFRSPDGAGAKEQSPTALRSG